MIGQKGGMVIPSLPLESCFVCSRHFFHPAKICYLCHQKLKLSAAVKLGVTRGSLPAPSCLRMDRVDYICVLSTAENAKHMGLGKKDIACFATILQENLALSYLDLGSTIK